MPCSCSPFPRPPRQTRPGSARKRNGRPRSFRGPPRNGKCRACPAITRPCRRWPLKPPGSMESRWRRPPRRQRRSGPSGTWATSRPRSRWKC
ncbi:MAG: hypothetical protein FJW39_11590 [Acidobacteria bacterium]|nr:hypothetical protein [Acidobacteriota bacterium]